jgi:DNA-binding MarR family transcriptional regulator
VIGMTGEKKRSDGERFYLMVQHLGRRLRDVDLACGISSARFSVLAHLTFHGVNNVGELASVERVSRPAMTRLVRDMEAEGLVRRRPDSRDGRGVRVEITRRGSLLIDRVRTRKIALVAQALEGLDPKSRHAISRAIEVFDN